MTQRKSWAPTWAVHPGELLLEELQERGLTQAEFARHSNLSPVLVNEIIKGKRGIGPDTALALEAALGASAEFWMNLMSQYELAIRRKKRPA